MSKMLRVAVTALALGSLALPVFAEDKTAVGGDPVVARVDGQDIHRSEIVRELQAMGPQAQQMPPQMLYPKLLENAIITKLVSAKGYAEKIQNDKDVKARLKQAEDQIVADTYIRHVIQPKITDAKIKVFYDEQVAKFKPEDEVHARHILVPTEAEANDIIAQLKAGGDFAKIAAEKSKDTGSSKKGGDLDFFKRGDMVKPFADAAFAMKDGEVSDKPVKTDFGYHVIKVEGHRKSSAPALADVKEQITNKIGQDMLAQTIKDMEAKAKIERFNIDGTPVKATPDATAATPAAAVTDDTKK